jgi:hypothetical protein
LSNRGILGSQEGLFFVEFIRLLIGQVVEGSSHDIFASTATVAFRSGGKPQKYGFRVDGRFVNFKSRTC